ncbi:protein DYAD [Humulus lupulus]|uniref:protein DYAD n=1 Tax=Humulus lupulus TaxID=3486 RepID=UPI002B414F6D|nr:protein DYAD [Humulus lupulus]
MAQWGVRRHVVFKNPNEIEDKKPCLLSSTATDQEEKGVVVKTETLQLPQPGLTKRKRLNRTQLKEVKAAALHVKQRQGSSKHKSKKRDCHIDRWSAERYKQAEKNMLDILKAEGATFQNPISRPALRTAARKCIGDTGLLDHLLKHLDGRVAPGGTERFRRWFNTTGVMEYWLEDAELVNVRQQAGVQDPYWIPRSGMSMRPVGDDSVTAQELKLLRTELNKMKSDMEDLACKKKEQYDGNQIGEMLKEMVKWKAETDQNLKVILTSWKSMQGMYEDLITWKAKLEQQLVEIRSFVSSMQESQQQNPASSPQAHEQWEDWLESTKLDDGQGNELIPWFDSTTTSLLNVEQEIVMQDLYSLLPLPSKTGDCLSQGAASSREMEQLKDKMIKKDGQEFPKNQKEDHANVTPDSSITANSMSDFHNSSFLCQEMFLELFNWKAKMEEKVNEIASCVNMIRQPSNY